MTVVRQGVMSMNLFIIGPAGSGKGTHALSIANRYGMTLIKVGDGLRDLVRSGSEEGRIAAAHMNSGGMVPPEITVATIKKQLDQYPKGTNFVVDSAPYDMHQAGLLDEAVGIDYMLLIDFDDYTPLFERLTKRRMCPGCHLTTSLMEAPNETCPKCGGALAIRDDDKPEVVKERLNHFEKNIRPVAEHFSTKGKLIRVIGDGTIPQIWERIIFKLDMIFKVKEV